ncbi:hypothetical protein CDAR_454401 [Caerostris darwini]|uniref:Uncharacterized protein n=1 Tax=Caerostris darwini TaxID=1538125 RepID=A0AAV4V6V0_9ARAC|nr:hypothetical protein CDAR_454401 [Caerostris darwini]
MEKNKITVLRIFSRTQSSARVWAEQHNSYQESPDKELEISKQKALKRTPLEPKSKQTQINVLFTFEFTASCFPPPPPPNPRSLPHANKGLRTNPLQANPYVKE